MIPKHLVDLIKQIDFQVKSSNYNTFEMPEYDHRTHYVELTKSGYFYALIALREVLKLTADYFFIEKRGARTIDLYMLTPSISSPMGLGSDSEAVPLKFGNLDSFLVDSSQFGFEPILLNNIDEIYCYLPSIRGEDPDKRHLNQFFNCEAEIRGGMNKLVPMIEDFVKTLAEAFLFMPETLKRISLDYETTKTSLGKIAKLESFPTISFDDAVDALVKNGYKELVKFNDTGRDLSAVGELKLNEILNFDLPFWVTDYDRDRVPFYQKPNPENPEKVFNADMIFPPLSNNSFGGEIVGCGQRQDDYNEMLESLKRQGVNSKPYEWYINLRKLPQYKTSSGFGLGVERFITWALCRDDIKNVIPYPRIKNVETYP